MNCDVALFQSLENEIHTLNEKLVDIEKTRQSCLDKLRMLDKEVQQNLPVADSKTTIKKIKANDMALTIINTYIQRIDNLLKVNDEPFLLDMVADTKGPCLAPIKEDPFSSQYEESQQRGKLQQVKDAYNQLIRIVMPKLFGKQFAHKNDSNYQTLKQNLAELRNKVHSIITSDEQKLVDAKRIFLQEIDGYLRTLDEMCTCTIKDCIRCQESK